MTDAQKKSIEKNLGTLDYLHGTGILLDNKRKLAAERYLFISSGGTGHHALRALRQLLEWKVDSGELAQKVRYLAVDCAFRELDDLVRDGVFKAEDVLKLPYQGAHASIDPQIIQPYLKEWVHPDLFRETGANAEAAAAQSGFDDTGAGAWRQCGRVRLHQSNSITELSSAIQTKVTELLVGAPAPTTLHVFFLAGIAGGTGSGTIVDLTYLTRHVIKTWDVNRYHTTRISGYILMPSACGEESNPIKRTGGNRRAYAALKEIDYYMGTTQRGEIYNHNYGTFEVNIGENLFDLCTLVEGVGAGGIHFSDPAKAAQGIIANSILNLICATEKKAGSADPFLLDSFTSNRVDNVRNAVIRMPHATMPRDAGYNYSVIGYSAYQIPRDLLTLYVANKVFEEVWRLFERCGEPNDDKAKEFLIAAQLDPKSVRDAKSDEDLKTRFMNQADTEFRAKGPYYMVNFMNHVRNVLGGPDFSGYAARKATGILSNKDAWQRAEHRYGMLQKYAKSLGSSLYDVYTEVIRQLQSLLRNNGKLLTDSEERRDVFGRSFFWSPIDLTNGDHATTAVRQYLDGLVSESETKKKAKRFVEKLCSKKTEWCELDGQNGNLPRFNAAEEIRSFIQEEFQVVIDATMELFLVKLNCNDKDAVLPTLPEDQDPEAHKPLNEAAQNIVSYLSSNATPLVNVSANFTLSNCATMQYIAVPDGCRWLPKKIERAAATLDNHEIYTSSSKDQVVFYCLYTGVPACALNWLTQAEQDYEAASTAVGLHLDWKPDGKGAVRFPDLQNRMFLRNVNNTTWRARENDLQAAAAEVFARAEAFGLAEDAIGNADAIIYTVTPGTTAQALLSAAEPKPEARWSFADMLADLKAKGLVGDHAANGLLMISNHLYYSYQQMIGQDEANAAEESRKLAETAVRRNLALWDALEPSLAVMEELNALIADHNTKLDRTGIMLDALRRGFIEYDANREQWKITLGNERLLGDRLDTNLKKQFKEYYYSLAFFAMDDKAFAAFKDEYDTAMSALQDATDEKLAADKQKVKATVDALIARAESMLKAKQQDRDQEIYFPMASLGFAESPEIGEETAKTLREFYDSLIRNL